ncbi:MAG: F0F1 ATP synthase subunit B [Burkholderiales bacterium]
MNINFTLGMQFVAFFAFIWFSAKFVWPPLLKAIEARQKLIADGLAAGERGKQDLAAAERKSGEAIAEARARAQEIIVASEKRAAEIVEQAKQTAKAEGDRLVTGAKAEIDQELSRARETLREQVATLVVSGAEKILQREVDTKAHAALLAQLKQQL